eukprot:TRINITY_DN1101_c0_g1_i1.p1 TRINITY_DN1101_c0_g1~~TRINITY_DN1101_c0_g1_i1.p1  ORF type:complete len:411 (-),score=75.30 TRINITY_DN1101_c0_g1_i1:86-1243(-)
MTTYAPQICQNPGCGKPSTMQCPTCISLKLPPSYFCSQDCFKSFWSIHKMFHAAPPPKPSDIFKGFKFTGTLRPAKVTPRRIVPKHIDRPDYADSGVPTEEIKSRAQHTIEVKSEAEIAGTRLACLLSREVLDIAGNAVRVGITTDEIDQIVHDAVVARNAYPSPLNYRGFPKSCCTSVNEVICHGIPDSRPLEDGDIVNVDISVYYKGYHGDVNETFFVGSVDPKYQNLVNTTYESLQKAISMVKPGAMYREVGEVITRVVHKQGFSVVKSYCGHGIGKLFHCAPNVPHYARNKAVGVMKEGHIFTIEPMINFGAWQDTTWPDEWTSVTEDGSRSAQFEETLLVTSTGCEVLTKRTRGSYLLPRFSDIKTEEPVSKQPTSTTSS